MTTTIPVTVYTKPSCPQCTATTRFLDANNIPYETDDATIPENTEAIKALGYQSAPVVIAMPDGPGSEVHWYGFNPDRLADLKAGAL